MTSTHVIESTDDTFAYDVLEASRKRPVVVDFWAPWCGPCQMLGPTLERIAEELDVTLVKVNTDENPQIAQAYKIQSIPAVKAFKDGAVVSEFLGAQPEPEVRRFFQSLAPSEADRLSQAGVAALQSGDLAEAKQHFQAALELDARHARATAALAAVLIEEGDLDGAQTLVDRLPGETLVKRQAARIRFERGRAGTEPDALLARIEANEDDVAAHYALGCHLARDRRFPEALEHFLEVVRIDRKYQEDAGKNAALQVFDVLGPDDPVTREYRPRLSMFLF